MNLKISHEEGYVLAKTSGSIEDSAGELFREHLHPLVRDRGTKLVLDLSESKRVNSMGLGRLVMLVANANTNASRVVLTGCSPFLSEVLRQSKLEEYFDVAASLSEAVERVLAQGGS
jgi:anti-anti-sigma factor